MLRAAWSLTLLAPIMGLVAVVLPHVFGWSSVAVEGASMGSAARVGSLAVLRPVAAADVTEGMVVLREDGGAAGTLVLHRVVAVAANEMGPPRVTTRGDANGVDDVEPYALPESVRVVAYVVPLAGYLASAVATPGGYALIVVLPLAVAVGVALVALWSDSRDAFDERLLVAFGRLHHAVAVPSVVAR